MTNHSGGAPVLYEDRTLFPTQVPNSQEPQRPQKTGLSAVGVIIVAIFAAAVAAGIVYFMIGMNPPATATTKPPVTENIAGITEDTPVDQIKTEAGLRKLIAEREKADSRQEVDLLKAQVAQMKKYDDLAMLEAQVVNQKAAVDASIAKAEAAGVPKEMLDEFKTVPTAPEPWQEKTERELRDYVKAMGEKNASITTRLEDWRIARARAQGQADADRKDCSVPGQC